jgi:hypothetical protein
VTEALKVPVRQRATATVGITAAPAARSDERLVH